MRRALADSARLGRSSAQVRPLCRPRMPVRGEHKRLPAQQRQFPVPRALVPARLEPRQELVVQGAPIPDPLKPSLDVLQIHPSLDEYPGEVPAQPVFDAFAVVNRGFAVKVCTVVKNQGHRVAAQHLRHLIHQVLAVPANHPGHLQRASRGAPSKGAPIIEAHLERQERIEPGEMRLIIA